MLPIPSQPADPRHARRMAASVAKLLELLRRKDDSP